MQNSDFQKFSEIYSAMFELLSKNNSRPSEMAVKLFFSKMNGITLSQFRKACGEHLSESAWMPTPADILQRINGKNETLKSLEADNAWATVYDNLRRMGANAARKIKYDPATDAAIRAVGGWDRLGNILEKEIPFLKKEFVAHFGNVSELPMIEGPSNKSLKKLIIGIGS